jgi:hypothetical protein
MWKSQVLMAWALLTKAVFMGYAEIHIQMPLFNNKKAIQKIVVLEIQTVSTCFGASSTFKIFFG